MASTLRLYNTLTKAKEPFVPIDPERVRIYACGPTVYDDAHIGNARPIIVFDLLFRLLRHLYGPDHVRYARNVTDVEDKINARAAERGVSIRELTDGTLGRFHEDIRALGVLMPEDVNEPGRPERMIEPRATDHIAEMRTLIERLLAAGHAYVAEEHVLFHVPSMPDYGSLSKRPLDEMEAGARVDVAPYKRSPLDFVLWKPSGPRDPSWPSPAGVETPGRPGWHIECSAMSWRHLGERFDIHAGGIDLVFPHHENEIAQSRCSFGTPAMANVWMHNGFLQVEGEKMAKSAGNFVTIRELLESWPGEALRLTMLKTQYRQPIDWTLRSLEDSKRELDGWASLIGAAGARSYLASDQHRSEARTPSPDALDALSDDLNTPEMLAVIREEAKAAKGNKAKAAKFLTTLEFVGLVRRERLGVFEAGLAAIGRLAVPDEAIAEANRLRAAHANGNDRRVRELTARLEALLPGASVELSESGALVLRERGTNVEEKVESLIEARRSARAARNFAESDRIRDELAAMGVALKDNKDGTTTWELARL